MTERTNNHPQSAQSAQQPQHARRRPVRPYGGSSPSFPAAVRETLHLPMNPPSTLIPHLPMVDYSPEMRVFGITEPAEKAQASQDLHAAQQALREPQGIDHRLSSGPARVEEQRAMQPGVAVLHGYRAVCWEHPYSPGDITAPWQGADWRPAYIHAALDAAEHNSTAHREEN